jgi:hypothetical protein
MYIGQHVRSSLCIEFVDVGRYKTLKKNMVEGTDFAGRAQTLTPVIDGKVFIVGNC